MGQLLHEISSERPPLFVGAGVIKSEATIQQFAAMPELAAQVIGSFSELEWGGNDPSGQKTVFHWDAANQAAYNAIGLQNCGRRAATEFLPPAIRAVQEAGQIAIVAVTSLKHEDPRLVLPDLVEWGLEMGADGVEINGSCPNEGLHEVLCADRDKTEEAIVAVRRRIGHQPYLSLKVSALSRATIQHYQQTLPAIIDGVSAINNCRRLSPASPVTNKSIIEVNDGYAGESGPIIASLARENLKMWLEPAEDQAAIPEIWSIGGVADGQEAYQRIHALGASLVGGAQAFYRSENPAAVVAQWAADYQSSGSW